MGMKKGVRLDQSTLLIELAEQLPEHPASRPSIRDRLEVADHMEIGCGRGGFGHGKGTGHPIETDEQTGARPVVTHFEAALESPHPRKHVDSGQGVNGAAFSRSAKPPG